MQPSAQLCPQNFPQGILISFTFFFVLIFNAPLYYCDFIFKNANGILLTDCYKGYQFYIWKNDGKKQTFY